MPAPRIDDSPPVHEHYNPFLVPFQQRGGPSVPSGPPVRWPGSLSASDLSSLPCVGCGWCCLTDQCVESHIIHGYRERCPEIFWDEALSLYRCRLSSTPRFRELLAMGEGCCAPLNSWREDVRCRDE